MKVYWRLEPVKVMDRPTALACLMTNLLVLPGLGSVVAGRRIGLAQMPLALAGVVYTLLFMVRFIRQGMVAPTELEQLWPLIKPAVLGLGLFGLAWLWSLITGLCVLHGIAARDKGVRSDVPPTLETRGPD